MGNEELEISNINVSDNEKFFFSIDLKIKNQLAMTEENKKALLMHLGDNVYSLTIPRNCFTSSQIKRLTDRGQYMHLPNIAKGKRFFCISLRYLKNYCYRLGESQWYNEKHALAFFYYCPDHVCEIFKEKLKNRSSLTLDIKKEIELSLSNKIFSYRIEFSKLLSESLWRGISLSCAVEEIINMGKKYLKFYKNLYRALKEHYSKLNFKLANKNMVIVDNGILSLIDYQALADEIFALGYENKIREYLKYFSIKDLNVKQNIPILVARSLKYKNAYSDVLGKYEKDIFIQAERLNSGKQGSIKITEIENNKKKISLWIKRSFFYLDRQNFKARAIFDDDKNPKIVSLVGDQISSIAIFPALLKGAIEHLNFNCDYVRVLSTNQDVITIGKDNSTAKDIKILDKKAHSLFKMISQDRADPLNIDEKLVLPRNGAGIFQFRIVPKIFFDLINTAENQHLRLGPGQADYLRGLALSCLQESGLAIENFKKSLISDRFDADVWSALGNAMIECGLIKDALKFFKVAFELSPEDPDSAFNLGRIKFETGDISGSIDNLERAVKLCPASPNYLTSLGKAYIRANRIHDALKALAQAIKCDPDCTTAQLAIAEIHLSAGKNDMARKHALLAYRSDPLHEGVADFLWNLLHRQKSNASG